jgi:apoptosis-inducing factor 2
MAQKRTRVVVAGLGASGVRTAVSLAKLDPSVEVVGISAKPGWLGGDDLGLRMADPRRWESENRIAFRQFRGLDGLRPVHGSLVGLDPQGRGVAVQLPDGSRVREGYDLLVVATGVERGFWNRPVLQNDIEIDADLREVHHRTASARTVAVVGGGPVAVNAAAQIALRLPRVRVHLYFPGESVLPRHHMRARKSVMATLKAVSVHLHPGHRAEVPAEAHGHLGSGRLVFASGQPAVEADVILWATGRARPNTRWLPPDLLDQQGFVRVAPDLSAVGADGIWAVGSVAATDPLRSSGHNGGPQLLARNLQAALRSKRLRSYKPGPRRWTPLLGTLDDGRTIFNRRGRAVRLAPWLDDALKRYVTEPLAYRGALR